MSSATFDEPNLVSVAGLVPLMALAHRCGLRELSDEHVTVPTDKGANPGLRLSSLVAGMAAGADSIDDMALLRHGAMGKVLPGGYAPSTLGSCLRSFNGCACSPSRPPWSAPGDGPCSTSRPKHPGPSSPD